MKQKDRLTLRRKKMKVVYKNSKAQKKSKVKEVQEYDDLTLSLFDTFSQVYAGKMSVQKANSLLKISNSILRTKKIIGRDLI